VRDTALRRLPPFFILLRCAPFFVCLLFRLVVCISHWPVKQAAVRGKVQQCSMSGVHELLDCQIANWYPRFQRVTLKTVILPLPQPVLDWLVGDVLHVPADSQAVSNRLAVPPCMSHTAAMGATHARTRAGLAAWAAAQAGGSRCRQSEPGTSSDAACSLPSGESWTHTPPRKITRSGRVRMRTDRHQRMVAAAAAAQRHRCVPQLQRRCCRLELTIAGLVWVCVQLPV
jgi:hypothetical protein